MQRSQRLDDERRRVAESLLARIEPLYRAAKDEGRTRDADYYFSVLKTHFLSCYGVAKKNGNLRDMAYYFSVLKSLIEPLYSAAEDEGRTRTAHSYFSILKALDKDYKPPEKDVKKDDGSQKDDAKKDA